MFIKHIKYILMSLNIFKDTAQTDETYEIYFEGEFARRLDQHQFFPPHPGDHP